MGRALEIIGGSVAAPGGTLTAVTPFSGNSLTVRNANKKTALLAAFTDNQALGRLRIRSPYLHDNVQGIRVAAPVQIATDPLQYYPGVPGVVQELRSQDNLTVELSGSATAGDVESAFLIVAYEDLPGVTGNFMSSSELAAKTVNLLTVENTIATPTTGNWAGEELLTSEFDTLKANTMYALIGYSVYSNSCSAVRYRCSSWGNLGLGGPGVVTSELTKSFFAWLSDAAKMPCIPVFNSADKSNLYIDCSTDENGADPTVITYLAELK